MAKNIDINGKAVTHPVARTAIGMAAVLGVGVVAAMVIFLVLPLVGIVVTLSVGLVGVVLFALGVGIPVLILGSAILGVVLVPFGALRKRKKMR